MNVLVVFMIENRWGTYANRGINKIEDKLEFLTCNNLGKNLRISQEILLNFIACEWLSNFGWRAPVNIEEAVRLHLTIFRPLKKISAVTVQWRYTPPKP